MVLYLSVASVKVHGDDISVVGPGIISTNNRSAYIGLISTVVV